MRRLFVLLLIAAGALSAPVAAQTGPTGPTGPIGPTGVTGPTGPTGPQEQRIAEGVSAGGIDVGGLLIEEARTKLRAEAWPRLKRRIVIRSAGRRYPMLPARAVKLRFDALRTAKRAYYAGRDNPPQQPSQPGAAAPGLDVPLAVTYSKNRLSRYIRAVDKQVHRAPVDATLRITLTRMIRRHSKFGRDMVNGDARAKVVQALNRPGAPHLVIPKLKRVKAKITALELHKVYPTVVTVDRANFRLRVFKNLRLSRSYGVAVGAAGYDTPTGLYRISNKAVNPVWTAPNKPWAGLYAGRSVPGGSAENPLKARWLGIVNGVGIHGTSAEYSIGSRASHGCIRMRVADVIDLYPRVPVGSPILIQ